MVTEMVMVTGKMVMVKMLNLNGMVMVTGKMVTEMVIKMVCN